MERVKLEETRGQRRLHIGSYFTDLNEADYQALVRIFSAQSTDEKQVETRRVSDGERPLIAICPSHAELTKRALVVYGKNEGSLTLVKHSAFIDGGVWMLDESIKRYDAYKQAIRLA